jgi:hypothetical protein
VSVSIFFPVESNSLGISVLETMNNHGKVDIYGYNFTKCWLLPHFRCTI